MAITQEGDQAARRGLRHALGRPIRATLGALGYDVVARASARPVPVDCDDFTAQLIRDVAPYTLTTPERIISLVDAVRYVVRASIPGAFAECGVWRGGSVMVIARTLVDLGADDRDLYLYDTFDQPSPPGEHDITLSGDAVADLLADARTLDAFAHLPMSDLEGLLRATRYPWERFHIVQGFVERTLPAHAPEQLALCRLDTDLYESTAHELTHLWPRLSRGGVLLVDDYGHFLGARKAVDEYFEEQDIPVLLHRIDSSARLVVKPG